MIQATGLAAAALGAPASARSGQNTNKKNAVDARKYLSRLIYKKQDLDDWFTGNGFPFARYHSEWGWLLRDVRMLDGIDGAVSTYTYPSDQLYARRMMAHRGDRPCRINTYGDSFTQCHQVNEGETWQEVLARHLTEPIRNFGVGAWSVYQAYLRMRYVEERMPSDVMIFNIYDDDHYRNLDAWRNIRTYRGQRFLCPTLPHLVVNPETGEARQEPNPCPTKESFYQLCDLDWVEERFKDDFVLGIMLAHQNAREGNPDRAYESIMNMVRTHGITTRIDKGETISRTASVLHARTAVTATMRIVDWIEDFAAATGKKTLYVLSFNAMNVARRVKEGGRFDADFVAYLKKRELNFVDLMEAHLQDFATYKGDIESYLQRYYIGHYNPWGNFFTAFAMKDKLVELLEPKPVTYQVP